MNRSVILLFSFAFILMSMGETFSQPSEHNISGEGHRLTKEQKQWVHQNRPESREKKAIPPIKDITLGKKSGKENATSIKAKWCHYPDNCSIKKSSPIKPSI